MKAVIIGAGKLGHRLADALNKRSIDIILVDHNEKVIERVNDHLDVMTVLGNGTDLELLKSLDLMHQDLVILTTSSDETNILIATMAKKLGCDRTVARLRNPEYTSQTDFFKNELGIDYIINPDLLTASEIVRYLLKNQRINVGHTLRNAISLVDISASRLEDYIGKPLLELQMSELLIAAVSRGGTVFIPDRYTELSREDVLYVIGKTSSLNRLSEHFRVNLDEQEIRRVMIMGGGKNGFYLAQKLLKYGVGVTIIEQDKNRCRFLSEELKNALIIHGNATDIGVLQEENVEEMDAFVAVTEYDEQNLLMSLMAKQSGVKRAIAKISQTNYVPVVDRLSIDTAFNPVTISIGSIIRFIHDNQVLSSSLMLEGDTDVTELVASEDTIIVNHKVKEIPFPKWVLLGAIIRGNQIHPYDRELTIQINDRLILFSNSNHPVPPDLFAKPQKGGFFGELSSRIKSFRGPSSP